MHPFQLPPQDVSYFVSLSIVKVDSLGSLFKIILVISLICVDGSVVDFHHYVADPVEEITVMGDHEESAS